MRLRADTRNLTSVGERETSDDADSNIFEEEEAVLERHDESFVVLVEEAGKMVGKVAAFSSLGASMDRGMECFTSRMSSSSSGIES
jgi:hypothetical protein